MSMERIFNDFELKKPPFVTLPSENSKFVTRFHTYVDTFLQKQCSLEEEFNEASALLSRLMARRKNSFRRMRGFKDVCKVNAALCRLLRVDLKRDLESFRNVLPDVVLEDQTIMDLPSRDCFEYLLLRIINFKELHERIQECSKSAAAFFQTQLEQNYFFDISTLFLAVLSNIYSKSVILANLSSNLYNVLIEYRKNWPLNLKSKFAKTSIEFPQKLSAFEDETPVVNNTQPSNQQQQSIVKAAKKIKLKKLDLGQSVERKVKQNSVNSSITAIDIKRLSSAKEIENFILLESRSRSNNLASCRTNKIQSHEWKGAIKIFERKLHSGEERKAVNIFQKFILSKIA